MKRISLGLLAIAASCLLGPRVAVASFYAAPPLPFEPAKPDVNEPGKPPLTLPDLIKELEQQTSQNPGAPLPWFRLGLAYAKAGRVADAIAALQKSLKLDPTRVLAWDNLGRNLAREHQDIDALAAFQHATTLAPNDPDIWCDSAVFMMLRGHYEDAAAALRQAFKLNAPSPRLWNTQGLLKEKQGDLPGALEAFNQAVTMDPNYAIGWCNIGYAQHLMNNEDASITSYEKAVAIDPAIGAAWINIAIRDSIQHNWKDAYAAAQKAVQFSPDNAGCWFALGHAAFGLRQWAEAVTDFQKAFDVLDPEPFLATGGKSDYGDAMSEYGLAAVVIGHFDDAEKILQYAFTLDSKGPRVLAALGELRLHQKRWQEARDYSQQSLDIDGTVPRTWANLGTALMGLNQPPGTVLAAYEKATQLQPDFDLAWWGAGQANEALNQPLEAAFDYRKAVAANPSNVQAWKRLALLATDPTESEDAMTKALALAPNDVSTLVTFGFLEARRHNWPAAEADDRKATELDATNGLAWADLGQALSAEKRYADAVPVLEKAVQNGNGQTPVDLAKWWSLLAIAHISFGTPGAQNPGDAAENQAGLDAATHATTLDPSNPVYWYEAWICQKRLGHLAEAQLDANKVTQLGGLPWQHTQPASH